MMRLWLRRGRRKTVCARALARPRCPAPQLHRYTTEVSHYNATLRSSK